ncbi:MAG: ribonuclease H-like domain-containing protein [Lachnospiraceae bacterium]|nr:ribonuclease H-like domain-containing protein [Lachnospiraceae bacterium]
MTKNIIQNNELNIQNIFKDVPFQTGSFVYLDIETTGFSKNRNHIFLVGLGEIKNNSLEITQFLAEKENEEPEILRQFVDFIDPAKTLVTYNGTKFDLPFLEARLNKYGLPIPDLYSNSLDMYKKAKSLLNFLSLPDFKQKTIEQVLHIKRNDKLEGRELVNAYKAFTKGEKELKDALLLHNKCDIEGLVSIFSIYSVAKEYQSFRESLTIEINSVTQQKYKALDGSEKDEYLIEFNLNQSLNNPVSLITEDMFLKADSTSGVASIKVFEGELKYFLPDYKSYYYLPEEDICVLKELATYVDASRKVKGTKENCYVKKDGSFLPALFNELKIKEKSFYLFKEQHDSEKKYIEADEKHMDSKDFWNKYICQTILCNLT